MNDMKYVRVRFAPSPTGWLHIGNARTALYNWLFARHFGGRMVLRIEDTDVERSTLQSEEGIFESMRWLGLDWDEGPLVGGDRGPYRQSERLDIYDKYIDDLLSSGLAYHCFCKPDQLEKDRAEALAEGKSPKYSGRCAHLSPSEVSSRLSGEPAAVRFRIPEKEIVLDDLIRGKVEFPAGELGDLVIRRSTGLPAYNFAVVIDDHLMDITHVIRGEDHLTNTAKQIFMYRALGFTTPRFAHLSMILGPDHTRLSKRHGATSVAQFREMGYLPEALVNYLSLLGWSPGDDREIMTRDELIEAFSLDRVSKSASIFDPGKLGWMNGVYLRNLDAGRFYELSLPFLEKARQTGGLPGAPAAGELSDYVEMVHRSAQFLSDVPAMISPFLAEEVSFSDEGLTVLGEDGVTGLLERLADEIDRTAPADSRAFIDMLKAAGKESGISGRKLFMPVRVALSGEVHGPDLDRVYLVLGPGRAACRIRKALAIAGTGIEKPGI